jgi:hypothetical protein
MLVLAALILSACGGSKAKSGAAADQPAPNPADFPQVQGQTMSQLRQKLPPGPALAPTVTILEPGQNRFGFGLFSVARKQIAQAPVAIYVQRSGSTETTGPYVARDLSLAVSPPFQSETVAKDPDAAKSLYVAHPMFKKPGVYAVMAVAKLDGRLVASDPIGVQVTADDPIPNVGDPAPKVDTPTVDSVHGDVASIDTRTPPGTMHDVDLEDVLGKKPVMLVFATPALCQSRVCGPVVDIAEEVKSESKGKAAFIHQEIYKDNRIAPGCLEGTKLETQCLRPQMIAYKLPSEPWLFAIGSDGKITARIEGAFSKSEMEAALKTAEGH